jgi:hypothetical protein
VVRREIRARTSAPTAANPDCGYTPASTVSIYRPQFSCVNPTDAATDPTQYQIQDINLTTGQASQLNLQAGGAMGINYHAGTHASTFEFGGQFRNEHKGQDAYSPTYDQNEISAPPPLPTMSPFLSNFTNPHYYGGKLLPAAGDKLYSTYQLSGRKSYGFATGRANFPCEWNAFQQTVKTAIDPAFVKYRESGRGF